MRVRRRRPQVAALLLSFIALALVPGGPTAPTPAAAATSITGLYVAGEGVLSESGPIYKSGAAPVAWTVTFGPMLVAGLSTESVTVDVDDPATSGTDFHGSFVAPPGGSLAVGTYANVARAPFQSPGQGGFDFLGGCSSAAGSFSILELAHAGPTVSTFAATFVYDCESQGHLSSGEIRFASSIGWKAISATGGSASGPMTEGVIGRPQPMTVTITGRGTIATHISSVALADVGGGVGQWAIHTDACSGATLAQGATCVVNVDFTAASNGFHYVWLRLGTDTVAPTVPIMLSASGVYWRVTGGPLEFGTQPIRTRSNLTLTFVNGSNPVQLSTPLISPSGSTFSVGPGGCVNALVPALGSCKLTIAFQPTAASTYSATVDWLASDVVPTPLHGKGASTSAVAWGTDRTAGRTWTWTDGYALGKTASGSTTYLHAIEATDYVGGKFATDTGPYLGVYYVRTSNEGSTWTTSARLNPTSQHAERPSLAASASMVYTSWVTQTKYVKFSPTAPRVLYVRANTNHGSSTAWRSAVRVTSSTGRVDFPTLAANGSTVYAAYTNSSNGNIRLSKSTDKGAHWTSKTLAVTSASTTEGKAGYPVVRVNGTRVIVVWTGDNAGKILARISLDSGTTWSSTQTLTSTSNGFAAAAASADRFAVAWTAADGPRVRTNKAGVWGTTKAIKVNATNPYAWHDTPAVSLSGSNGTAVAWGACFANCANAGTVDLIWAESTDGGTTFPHIQVLATQTVGANWWPSVAWSGTKRYVLYERDSEDGTYRLRIRTGTGSP